MAQRFYEPIARIFTNAGLVGVGYKYYFYQTGTTTPVTTYQNIGLTVANTNPVVSDSNGRFPDIFYSDLSQLKLIVKDSSGNIVEGAGADPVGASASAVSLNDFDVRPTSYWGLTAGTSTAFTLIANPTISAYANTQTFVVQPHLDCGDSPTLAVDGLSALNWKKYTQQGTKVALKANDLRGGQRYFCINDGVDIVALNPSVLPILSGSATALTIATDTVTLTNNSSSYVLDTEGAAASDNLSTISGGQEGQIIFIYSAADARNIIIKHNTGNIFNPYATDITLDLTSDIVELRYSSVSAKWIVISQHVRFDFLASKSTNGYTYLPNGVIYQWGVVNSVGPNSSTTITFPIAFPTANTVGFANPLVTNTGQNDGCFYNLNSTSQATITNTDGSNTNNISWFAIGY